MIRVNNHTAAINSSRTEVAMKRDTKIDDQKKEDRVSSAQKQQPREPEKSKPAQASNKTQNQTPVQVKNLSKK